MTRSRTEWNDLTKAWYQENPQHLATFETHLTYEHKFLSSAGFRESVEKLKSKPLVIALLDSKGQVIRNDFMTATLFPGTHPAFLNLDVPMLEHYDSLVRQKVETHTTWYDMQKGKEESPIEPGMYFEAHIKVVEGLSWLSQLMRIAEESEGYVSYNTLKKSNHAILTIRAHEGTSVDFDTQVARTLGGFGRYGMTYDGVDKELCIFDSNVEWDADWREGK